MAEDVAIRIGNGSRRALLVGLPHPDEPIGSLTSEYLASRLVADHSPRQSLDYTWHLVKRIDPDGARLNEG